MTEPPCLALLFEAQARIAINGPLPGGSIHETCTPTKTCAPATSRHYVVRLGRVGTQSHDAYLREVRLRHFRARRQRVRKKQGDFFSAGSQTFSRQDNT